MRYVFSAIIVSLLLFSCVKDRVQPTAPPPPVVVGSRVLIHYWNFNTAPVLTPNVTIGGGNISFDFTTESAVTGYYDSLASATLINARNNDTAGNALRVRNPVLDMVIAAP